MSIAANAPPPYTNLAKTAVTEGNRPQDAAAAEAQGIQLARSIMSHSGPNTAKALLAIAGLNSQGSKIALAVSASLSGSIAACVELLRVPAFAANAEVSEGFTDLVHTRFEQELRSVLPAPDRSSFQMRIDFKWSPSEGWFAPRSVDVFYPPHQYETAGRAQTAADTFIARERLTDVFSVRVRNYSWGLT